MALAAVGLLAIVGVGWALGTFAPSAEMPSAQSVVAAVSAVSGVAAPAGPAPAAPDVLHMGDVAAAATAATSITVSVKGTSTTSTPGPTLGQWSARAPGIVVDPVLVSRLDRVVAGLDGHIGIAVKDLGSGRGAVLDGDLELPSASLYKLPVLYSVFAAGLSMNEDLSITEDALSYDAGTMELGAGETLTVAEALERMVTLSDNTSAVMLGGRVGPGRINANIAALGMDTTHYSLERMTTSALDMLHLVELVADGKAVSPSASADMLHLMLRQRVNDRLPRLLPDDVQVAHKTGNLPGTVNDVGVLYGPGSTIAIAALVSDTSDEAAAASAIAQLASVAYLYFDDQPEVSDRPLVPPAPARLVPPVWRVAHPPTPTPVPTEEATAEPEVVATPALSVAVPRSTGAAPQATIAPTLAPKPTAAPPTVAPPPPTATLAPPPPTQTPLPPPTQTPLPAPTKAPTRPAAGATPTAPSKH